MGIQPVFAFILLAGGEGLGAKLTFNVKFHLPSITNANIVLTKLNNEIWEHCDIANSMFQGTFR